MEHMPPALYDPQLEREVMGTVINHPHLADSAIALGDDAYTDPRLQLAHEAVMAIYTAGGTPSTATVRDQMRAMGDVGDDLNAWLGDLASQSRVLPGELSDGIRRLGEFALKRRIVQAAQGVMAQAYDTSTTGSDCLGVLDGALNTVQGSVALDDSIIGGAAALEHAMTQIEERGKRTGLAGLTTGSHDLDRFTEGLHPGQLIVVGARPSVGKSIVATDTVRAALRAGAGVLMFSLEMSADELMSRILSAESSVNGSSIKSGRLNDMEWAKLARGSGNLPWENLTIVDRAGITASQVAATVRQQARHWDREQIRQRLVVIDYLQIMGEERLAHRKDSTRQQMLGYISTTLKNTARDHKLPVMALAQAGRGAQSRPPTTADLRESGDIEAAADCIWLLHREDLEDPESLRAGEIDYHIAKQRNGPTGVITRATQFKYTRIEDLARV